MSNEKLLIRHGVQTNQIDIKHLNFKCTYMILIIVFLLKMYYNFFSLPFKKPWELINYIFLALAKKNITYHLSKN